MIPLYRASKMEQSVDLLAKNFRQVVVDASHYCIPAIRIRADMLNADRIYFDRTQSQITAWQSTGGILIRWNRKTVCGPYDAIFYQECPRSIELLDRYSQECRWISVIFSPPTWRGHFEGVAVRNAGKPEKKKRELNDAIERVKQLLESSDPFTSGAVARLLLSHPGQIVQPSSVPVSRVSVVRAASTTHGVP
jgi:hypothetical protein